MAPNLLRRVLVSGALGIAASAPLLAGCPVPFPSQIQTEADAGVNSTPVIQRATPADLTFPGPLVVARGDDRIVTLHLKDTDVSDTLFIRMFRDYDPTNPTPQLVNVDVPVAGSVERLREVSLATWCAGLSPVDADFHFLVAMVADRPFLDCSTQPDECADQPQFRELPAAAESSTVAWTIKCDPPQ